MDIAVEVVVVEKIDKGVDEKVEGEVDQEVDKKVDKGLEVLGWWPWSQSLIFDFGRQLEVGAWRGSQTSSLISLMQSYFMKKNDDRTTVHNVLFVQFFSIRPNEVRHVVKFHGYIAIKHIFIPARSVEWKIEKIGFS